MGSSPEITSPRNRRLASLRRLRRKAGRASSGLFLAEGEDLLAESLRAGRMPVEVFATPEAAESLAFLSERAEVVTVARAALDSVSALGSGSRVISVFRQVVRERELAAEPVVVYLEAVSDPGNVGAAIRLVHALVEGVCVLGAGCADPSSEKAVRASMGSIFANPPAFADFRRASAGRRAVAFVAHGGEPLDRRMLAPPVALCFGSERSGLPGAVAEQCDERVSIPLRAGGAESLNVAMACAIGLHEASMAMRAVIDSPAGDR